MDEIDYYPKKKKILLIRPPLNEVIPILPPNLNKKIEDIQGFYTFASQPSGILRIGSHLKNMGNTVKFIDCAAEIDENKGNSIYKKTFIKMKKCGNYENEKRMEPCYHLGMSYEDLKKELLKEQENREFDEIWITSCMTYNWEPVHKIIEICKETFPNARVILGGLYATLCPEYAKKSKADVIYQGEFEPANNCRIDLDILGYIPNYIVLKSTRGCPNNCSYCAVSALEGRKMRFRDYKDIFGEIKEKLEKYGIKKFIFWESNLLINSKQHFEKLLDLIIENNIKIELDTPEGLQPKLVTAELANKMKAAGFKKIYIPLENVDEKECKERFKRISILEDFENCISHLKKVGFDGKDISVFILSGLPNQDVDTVLRSLIKVWELECNPRIMPFTPIPSTEEYKKHHHLIKDRKLDELHPFLFCCANKETTCEDLKTICYFNRVLEPIEFIKRNYINNKIFNRIIELVKESEIIWDNYYKRNLDKLAWLNENNPDQSIKDFILKINLKKGSKILDVGCGTGKNSNYLQKKGFDVYGIDISQNAITNIVIKKDKNKFLMGNILKIEYSDDSFDAIIDIGCLHMINKLKYENYFIKTRKMLKKGGYFLIRTFSENGHNISRFFKEKGLYKISPFLNYNKKEELIDLLSQYFQITDFKELFWCSILENDEYVLKPGMYQIILKKE